MSIQKGLVGKLYKYQILIKKNKNVKCKKASNQNVSLPVLLHHINIKCSVSDLVLMLYYANLR